MREWSAQSKDLMTSNRHGTWSSECALCQGLRVFGVDRVECPWCKSVRMKYGNYFYPIDASNVHLFRPSPKIHTLTDAELQQRMQEAYARGVLSQQYYGA